LGLIEADEEEASGEGVDAELEPAINSAV